MIPNVADRGASFKGIAAYLLHDKKDEEAEEHLYTSDRVEWTATRNFYKDNLDPDIAFKVMAATAMDQDRLKRQAGVRKSGQQSKGAVYHYSIAWHPEENGKIDKAEMMNAAEQSLEAIGAQDRQTMIVCHNDEDHPHVHLVVNLVSQDDGRNLVVHADYNKLEAWALEYRRARGEELLYVPSREEKAQAKEATKRGEKVDFVRGQKSVPRHMLKDYEQARKANPQAADRELNNQRQLDKDLATQSIQDRETRAKEAQSLEWRLKVELKDINRQADAAIHRAEDLINKQYEPERTDQAAQHF
ncbi:MAG: relaxase/mobilization nuclease domain-containing protein, partial [Pseudomonadota bacterium]